MPRFVPCIQIIMMHTSRLTRVRICSSPSVSLANIDSTWFKRIGLKPSDIIYYEYEGAYGWIVTLPWEQTIASILIVPRWQTWKVNHHRFGEKRHGIPEHTDCLTHQAAFATWFHGVVRVFGILGVQSHIRLGVTSLALTKARRLWKLPMELIHIQTSVDHISFIWYINIIYI